MGGARSGKSALAEQLAVCSGKRVHYLATAQIWDEEMKDRVAHHKNSRPNHWQVTEEAIDIIPVIKKYAQVRGECLLLDCLTLWLTNILLLDDEDVLQAHQQQLVEYLQNDFRGELILVSNEVGQGIIPDNALARRFVDEAGRLHQRIAKVSDQVVFVTAGIPQTLKGPLLNMG
nr:bifunctional adenosylcobinamide kinase/adenosylcobinamide-phosphate guanylyltransferase [Oceanospirillum sediminis]